MRPQIGARVKSCYYSFCCIQDYGEVAVKLENAAAELSGLPRTFDQTLGSTDLMQLSAQVGPAAQQVVTRGKEVVDYAFWRGVLLVLVVLVAAIVYRVVCWGLSARSFGRGDA